MLEAILKFSIFHRWLVVLLFIVVAAIGVFSFQKLPIDAVPDITNNQVQINTIVPALSPEAVEKQVTFPLETAMAGIPGLQNTRSISRNGFSQVTVVFDDDVDIYFARQQVLERIGEAKEYLPEGADPKMGAISTGLGEIYMYTVDFKHPDGKIETAKDGEPGWQKDGTYLTPEGEILDSLVEKGAYLRTVQDWIIRPQLRGVKGVAGVDSIGGYEKQYHVQPDPLKLASYGLTFHDIIEALESNNVSTGAGYIEHKGESYTVRADGRIQNMDQIRQIVLANKSGVPVRIRDVASVGVGKELRTGSASENEQEVVVGTALMLIGANSRTVSEAVDQKIQQINRALPPDIEAKTVLNRTALVDRTLETIEHNLFAGALLVVVILFLMLGNIRAALITALVIPMSMLMTMTGMVQSKMTGNLMSLGALDFGLIVDGAVVVVENTLRLLAEKQHRLGRKLQLEERLETVFRASKQVLSVTLFGQAIIITVYIPILTLTGVEGKMFQPMAMTVIFALISAFVLSLTLIPALVGIFMTGKVTEKENFLVRSALWMYRPIVRWAVKLRYIVVLATIAAFAGSVLLFLTLGQEFVPTLDEKDIAMQALRIPSTSLTQSAEMQKAIEKVVDTFPEVAFVYSKIGTAEMAADPMPPSVADTFIILKPKEEWPNPEEAKAHFIERLEAAVSKVPGSNFEFTQPIEMRFNELVSGVRSDVAVKVYGDQFEQITPVAEAIAKVLQSIPGAADVKVEQTEGLPVMNIKIDREKIARYGLNMADVQDVIAIAVGGREAGVVFQGDRRFDLVVRLPEGIRKNVDALLSLPIPLPETESSHEDSIALAANDRTAGHNSVEALPFVSLGAVADIAIEEGPNQISRDNGKRRIVVQANVRGSDLGTFVKESQKRVDQQVKLPAGTWVEWGGQFENLVSAKKRLSLIVPICLFVIFLLLFSTFNSAKYALLVFSGIPLALSGGIVALWVRDIPFSISAAVGFIALSGVAVLNGLVMVTFINQLRQDGEPLEEAIVTGSITRLRPVLMTALVASLGFVPMAMATGAGAEVQKPLATVVIGGIISSTLLTLLVLPALYRIFHFKDDVLQAADSPPVHHNPELVHETKTP